MLFSVPLPTENNKIQVDNNETANQHIDIYSSVVGIMGPLRRVHMELHQLGELSLP